MRNATNAGVFWKLHDCTGDNCGAIGWDGGFDQLHTKETYVAPSTPQTTVVGTHVTLTATSVEDNTKSASATITLTAAPVNFSPEQPLPIGSSPVDVLAADVNGDGTLDIVAADHGDPVTGEGGGASILLGNGDGTFQPATHFAAGADPIALAVGDLNRDGRKDLVVLSSGNGNMSVLLGRGDGTFQTARNVVAGDEEFRADSLVVDDVNDDGAPDVVVVEGGDAIAGDSGNIDLLVGNGDGTLQAPVRIAAGLNPVAVVTADLNGDGAMDLAAAHQRMSDGTLPSGVSILLGSGTGTFLPPAAFGVVDRPTSLATGDVNGDGMADLVVSGFVSTRGINESAFRSGINILVGDGAGHFTRRAITIRSLLFLGKSVVFPPPPRSLRLGDFNGDGFLDAAEINVELGGSVCVVLGKGDGDLRGERLFVTARELIWQGRLLFPGGMDAAALAIGDMNSDGRPDIFVANSGSNSVRVLLNTSGT